MNTHVPPRSAAAPSRHWAGWPLERVLFAMAGTVTLASAALAAAISPWWLLLAALVGINQLAFVAVGDCISSVVLRRVFGLQRGGTR
jgi:Zn-dependent protease